MFTFFQVSDTNHPALYFNQFEIEKPHWIAENKELNATSSNQFQILDDKYDFKFQNKHVQTPIVGLTHESGPKNETRYIVDIKNPFRAIVAGQVSLILETN